MACSPSRGAFLLCPRPTSKTVEMIHSPHFRGYTRAGRELTRGRPDWREQFDIGAERECGWRAGDPRLDAPAGAQSMAADAA